MYIWWFKMQVGRNKGKHQIRLRGNDQKSYPDFTIE